MNVLVVEDQKTIGMALTWTLAGLGHEARLVSGGDAAWEILSREDWRLIITDWMMPGGDGPELCRRIRGQRGGHYRYVIMLTGRTGRSDRLEGLEAGADDFLTKPVDEDELVVRLGIARRILDVQRQLEDSVRQLGAAARTDFLTRLSNRRGLDEALPAMMTAGRPCSAIAIDIDRFKAYNDSFGHAAGDDVLRTIGTLLRSGTGATGTAYRVGGEEFLVLLPGSAAEEASSLAEELRSAIAAHSWSLRPVTASLGVATADSALAFAGPRPILDAADRALYHSKRTGRDRTTHARSLDEPDVAAIPPRAAG